MFDHITQQNSQLIRQLNKDQRIQSAWYFNGKIFTVDHEGVRHKFDILDSVDRKLKNCEHQYRVEQLQTVRVRSAKKTVTNDRDRD